MLARAADGDARWDVIVVGGGATGAGIAVDAASRGYQTLLLERGDFGQGTSSRSTKLVHGGVRYLKQGDVGLVMEALRERGRLRANAPHLVRDLAFVVPTYDWWEGPFYGVGLKVYDLLAGRYGFGESRRLPVWDVLRRIPTLETEGLDGGVLYYDGQFDDARLLINLMQTAGDHGAAVVNYAQVVGLLRGGDGFISGVKWVDREAGSEHAAVGRVVINATGPFADGVRQMDDADAEPMIAASQGAHLVLPAGFLSGETAIMVPKTSDGRVLFAIPWHGYTVVGTTETPLDDVPREPRATADEVGFILETAGRYLDRKPRREDVLSVWAGVRPLVKAGEGTSRSRLSRDHTVHIADSGLVTVTGGKWTTYRRMAKDAVDQAAVVAALDDRPCVTRDLTIHGGGVEADAAGSVYGSDAAAIAAIAGDDASLADRVHDRLTLTGAEVVWAARHEMARTVEDVLARRHRALLLDAAAAGEAAARVAAVMADELGLDAAWQAQQVEAFTALAASYLPGR